MKKADPNGSAFLLPKHTIDTIALRALSQGYGSFTFYFVRYEEAPANIAQKIIENAKKNND